MRASFSIALVTAALAAVAGQTSCTHASTRVTQDRFPDLYAQALCTSLQPCCAENKVAFDFAACTRGWAADVSNLMNASGNYDATAAANCIAQVSGAQNVSCQPGPGSLSSAHDTCQSIFAGTAQPGDPCTSAAQCAPQPGMTVVCAAAAADGGDGGGSGGGGLPLAAPGVQLQGVSFTPQDVSVCVALPASAPPAGCTVQASAGTDSCISSGAFCDTAANACAPFNPAGGPCDPAVLASCVAGNYCVAGAAGTPAMCTAAGPVGSTCTAQVMCDSTGYCDTGSGTCVAILPPNAPCTASLQCSVGVCDATTHTCLTNSVATTAACTGVVGP
jgi:hypothetical protein